MALVLGPVQAGSGASSRTRSGQGTPVAARFLNPGVTKNGPGNTCSYVYDGLGRMVRQVCDLRVGGTGAGALDTTNPRNPDGQISLGYVFDKNSRLVGIVDDNGNRTSFGYDALNRKTSHTNADGSAWAFTYDRDHNVRTVTDPNGSVATKTYDAVNRLVQVDVLRAAGVVGTTRETFAYDGLSRLVFANDDNGGAGAAQTWEGVFDSLGRLLEERQSGKAVSSQYTGDGKRHQVTYPGGRVISRTFDVLDRIKQLKDGPAILAASDWIGPSMRELQRLNGNGTRLTFLNDAGNADVGYDAVQRITRLRVLSSGAAIVDREYGYNRASQRTLERRHDDFGLTDTYAYDSTYRVIASAYDQAGLPGAVPRDLSAISYQLDGVGNRRQVQKTTAAGTTPETFAVNAVNEYTSITTGAGPAVARSHDQNGNLADDGTRLLSYDYKNRLVGVLRKADLRPIAVYRYLPDGRRSRKQVFDPDTGGLVQDIRFICDGPQEVEEQDWNSGVTLATYVWSPVYVDELVEFNRTTAHPLGAGSFFAHQDARCGIVAITNATGAVVERRRYDDYGREEIRNGAGALVATSHVGLDYGFQGRRHDRETGLIFFRARYYDPGTGRFLQRDPVWDAANVGGQYSFAGNGPVSGRDPTGLWGLAELKAAAEGFVEGLGDTFVRGQNPFYQGYKAEQAHIENVATAFYERGDSHLEAAAGSLGIVLGDAAGVTDIYEAETGINLVELAETGQYTELDPCQKWERTKSGSIKLLATLAGPALRGAGRGGAGGRGASGGSRAGTGGTGRTAPPGRGSTPPPPAGPRPPAPPGGGKQVHIDVGGEGRYPGAINLNPRATTTTTGQPGQPIPNLVRGRGEAMPFKSGSADVITVESAPLRPGAPSEIARVVKPGGEVRLVHPDAYAAQTHPAVVQATGGAATQTSANGVTTTIIRVPP